MRRRWLALGLVAVLIFAIGMAIGRQSDSPEAASPPTATVTVTEATRPARKTHETESGFARTREGAVSAAATYIGSLDGRALVNPATVKRRLTDITSSEAREGLVRAYVAAAKQTQTQLGIGTAPEPIVILRASPVGYRVAGFTPAAATVAIWRVGIVGSGATAEPQQSWRTETVSLVWEKKTWKVAALRSEPGPTPPLPAGATTSTATELFTSIPEFEEFERELP